MRQEGLVNGGKGYDVSNSMGRTMLVDGSVAMAFPTLIGKFTVSDASRLNVDLMNLIAPLHQTQPSKQLANAGGWHSGSDLFDSTAPAILQLKQSIGEALQAMVRATAELPEVQARSPSLRGGFRITGWANVIGKGHYHRQHNHPGSAWSGVYYVKSPPTLPGSLSGLLELFDPRPFTEMTDVPGSPYGQRILLRPDPGLMVLFPGWLYHFVHPLQETEERVSIAFNAAWRADSAI